MRIPSVRPWKPSPKAQVIDVGRWRPGQVAAFCSVLALVSVRTSVVIGQSLGGANGILVALIISVSFILLFGSIALAFVALGSIFDAVREVLRRAAGPSNPESGGVSDEWLDGPV